MSECYLDYEYTKYYKLWMDAAFYVLQVMYNFRLVQ